MSLENIGLENLGNAHEIDPATHKQLDLVRRLEKSGFIFATDPKVATDLARSSDGTPTDKLIYRATLMDSQGDLQTALHKGDFLVKGVGRLYAGISFVAGFVGVLGLLSTHVVNFFYVLLGLLGWHTVTLILWFVGLNNPNRYSGIYGILDRLRPKSAIESEAFDIHQEEFQKKHRMANRQSHSQGVALWIGRQCPCPAHAVFVQKLCLYVGVHAVIPKPFCHNFKGFGLCAEPVWF